MRVTIQDRGNTWQPSPDLKHALSSRALLFPNGMIYLNLRGGLGKIDLPGGLA